MSLNKQHIALDAKRTASTQPPQRPWVGLTEEETDYLWQGLDENDSWELIKRVEAKLKTKNE